MIVVARAIRRASPINRRQRELLRKIDQANVAEKQRRHQAFEVKRGQGKKRQEGRVLG